MNRRAVVSALVPLYLALIVGVPFLAAVAPIATSPSSVGRLAAALAAAPVFCVTYLLVAGALSRLTLRAIVPGRYPRDLGHEVYGPRRLYALCWTAVYYCAPVYHAALAIPTLKRITFRLFGYHGDIDFQTYPDTWLRDLPLLTLGKGAYLSNKATVSPNMCLRNGTILIAPVKIGSRTMVGHLTMIAPGVVVGDDSEVGVGAGIGVKARIGSRTNIDHEVVLDHGAIVGDRCVIGTRAYIGRRAVIHDGIRIPPMMVVPAKTVLASQADVEALAAEHVVGRPSTLAVRVEEFTPTVDHA
jgi:acetyltransferase-like isoleucine patch superfamily enzyme